VTPAAAAIVGPGAIGSFFAAQLGRASKVRLAVCARTAFDTLTVVSEAWGETVQVHAQVVTSVEELAPGPVDWVLLSTKAHQTAGAAPWLEQLCAESTTIVVLQNGVEHVERVRPLVPAGARILPAVVHCGAELQGPGRVLHRTNGYIVVPRDADASGERLAQLFEPEHDVVRTTVDFVTEAWKKLCTNVAVNGITALTGRRLGVMREPTVRHAAEVLLDECVEVARASGAQIDGGHAGTVLARMGAMPETAGTSMLYDRLAGRSLEFDAIYGAAVRAGRRWGIPTPATDQLFALLGAIETG
jgi:2-dehydropantoate 2-reductase